MGESSQDTSPHRLWPPRNALRSLFANLPECPTPEATHRRRHHILRPRPPPRCARVSNALASEKPPFIFVARSFSVSVSKVMIGFEGSVTVVVEY